MKLAESAAGIRQIMGMANASKFMKHYLDLLLKLSVIEMRHPDFSKKS